MKFFGVAAMGIIMQVLKFWLDIKNGYNPPKIVHYNHPSISNPFAEEIYWARQLEEYRKRHGGLVYPQPKTRDSYSEYTNEISDEYDNP